MIASVTRYSLRALLVFLFGLSLASPALHSQTVSAPRSQTANQVADTSLLPGPEPPACYANCEQLIGVFGDKPYIIILERDGALFYRAADGNEYPIRVKWPVVEAILPDSRQIELHLPVNNTLGPIPFLGIDSKTYRRADGAGSPWFHITPAQPIAQLRAEALAAQPPAEKGPFRKPELVELTKLDPAIHLDIRYAQSNNFLSTPIYTQARAFLQRPAAEALLRVLHKLQPFGYGLLIHDAYRPWYVTKMFWDATPPADHIFVADPQKGSRHNRGCAVDLTLYDLATGKPIEMTGMYDEMSPRSFPDFPGGTSLQRWHRDLLRRAMESEGFTVNEEEWWHFDYKDWKQYPILNVPFEKLGSAAAD